MHHGHWAVLWASSCLGPVSLLPCHHPTLTTTDSCWALPKISLKNEHPSSDHPPPTSIDLRRWLQRTLFSEQWVYRRSKMGTMWNARNRLGPERGRADSRSHRRCPQVPGELWSHSELSHSKWVPSASWPDLPCARGMCLKIHCHFCLFSWYPGKRPLHPPAWSLDGA